MKSPVTPRAVMIGLALQCLAPILLGSDLTSVPELPLDLFQRIARSDLVVHVRTYDGTLRYAVVDVVETFKGTAPSRRLRISFRDFNFQRPPGVSLIVFPNRQEEILFLVPHSPSARRKAKGKDQDLFDLLGGVDGRISLPAEGSGEQLDAVRQLVAITGSDPSSQIDGLIQMLDGTNLILIESALDEIGRLRAATPSCYGRLMRLLSNPSPGLRLRALRLIGATFQMPGGNLDDPAAGEQQDSILAAVLERARNDPGDAVRVEAVLAVAAWPNRGDVEADLRAIAAQDPSQAVRYEAERALFRSHPR